MYIFLCLQHQKLSSAKYRLWFERTASKQLSLSLWPDLWDNARRRGHIRILMLVCAHCRFACVHNLVSYIGNYSRYTILHCAACMWASASGWIRARFPFIFTRAPPTNNSYSHVVHDTTTCLLHGTPYMNTVYELCISTRVSCLMNIGRPIEKNSPFVVSRRVGWDLVSFRHTRHWSLKIFVCDTLCDIFFSLFHF